MEKSFPILKTQLGLFIAEENASGKSDYNICLLYRLDGDVDVQRLKEAVAKVLDCHPYVCSTLVRTDDGDIRIVPPAAPLAAEDAVREFDDKAALKAEMCRRFDIFSEPLFRFGISISQDGSSEIERWFGLCFHHIVFDGFSFSVFKEDLATAYAGGTPEPEETDGFEIAVREETARGGEEFQEAKAWYGKTFAAASEAGTEPIPDVYEAPGCSGPAETWKSVAFPLAVGHEAVSEFSRKHGVGISVPFTAAFGYALANFTAVPQTLFATIHHGRFGKEVMRSFGMMVKTFPVSCDFSEDKQVGELLRETSEQIREARRRTVYSFGDCCRDLSLNPQVCFAFQGRLYDYAIELDGKRQETEDIRSCRPGYDIIANVYQAADGGYKCMLQYSERKYSDRIISDFAGSYDTILTGMLSAGMLSDINPASEAQKTMLRSFSSEPERAGENDTIVSLFRAAAKAHPDNTAVIFGDRRISYKELDERSDRAAIMIAGRLPASGRGTRPEFPPVVAILMGRSEIFPIFTLAALKAGAAYQPLDPSYPQERLDFMVKDSCAALLVSDRDLLGLIDFDGEVMITDEALAAITAPQPSDTLTEATGPLPQTPLALIYTSGSTGVPKGVIINHRNLATFCHWYRRYYDLNPGDCVAAYASFGFDADLMDLYAPLTSGAASAIVPEGIRLDLDALSTYFAESGVTHSFITTQVGYQFATLFPEHSTLRHLSVGGEKLTSIAPPKGYSFYNVYGPTECTVYSTAHLIDRPEQNIPIGRPLDTLTCRIVNRFGQDVPVGAAGELIISGEQVAEGYLNRPEKTAEVFGVFGGHTYRSGDIVRYRADGGIEFVGRNDGQVKIRGFRIELKEIEAVIREFEGIRDVTVQAFDLESGGKFIAAYVVSDGKVDVQALCRFIMSRKPPYMVPAVTMQIDAIPLNVNQKVDRKKLPKPEACASQAATADDPGETREPNFLEKRLLSMAETLLSCRPGLADPLTYSGLSSILSMRMASMLHKEYGIKLTSAELLSGLSISDIENRLLEMRFGGGTAADGLQQQLQTSETITSGTSRLSFSQRGVYADCLAHPASTLYNIPMEIRFPASVTAEALKDAAESVIRAHPILFAVFRADDENEIVQEVPGSRRADIPIISGKELSLVKKSFVRPFKLDRGPLWRALVVEPEKSAGVGPVLLLDIHHLICDGGSFDIIIKEISAILDGGNVSVENYTYLDFCKEQEAFAAGDAFVEHKEFFARQLAGFENSTEVPSDIITSEPPRQAEVAVPLPQKCLEMKIVDVTAAGFWLAASAYAIGRYANVSDTISIAAVSSGRQNLSIGSTVGMFVNTLPVRISLGTALKTVTAGGGSGTTADPGILSVKEYVRNVAAVLRETVAHENYPFSNIAADYGYTAGITYAYQLGVISDTTAGGESVQAVPFGLTEPKFKIGILLEMYGGEPSLVLQYDDSLYSRALMMSLAESIVTAAGNMADSPDAPVRSISILSENQKKTVVPFHKVADSVASVATFHGGIARWAAETPDAKAVVAVDRTLTYREFDREACRMARALTAKGLKKGDRAVLLLPRRSDFLVAVYAVMKCGAAYIPMDPEYPTERISYILENSEGRFVLTTADRAGDYPGRALDIEEVKAAAAKCPPEPFETDVTPDDLAYMIYTSGSTGVPKGVMLQHRGIVNYLTPHPANPHTFEVATRSDGVVCSATVSFDLSILEYGTALFNGRMLVFADENTVTDSLALAELYRSTGADVLSGTPSRIETYMEMQEYRDVIRDCKVIQMGGEKLSTALLKKIQHITGAKIYNMYGPTEITICCNAQRLDGRSDVTAGKPLPGFSEYVIDTDGNELPAGVMGELLISGAGVSPGYYKLPEKTAAAFIEWNGERAYRSGDYARWNDDGEIVILGRTDSQVKLNGLRIELGEIETVMGGQKGVRQCVVAIRKVGRQDKLVAWYTTDGPCTADGIRAGMAERLTPYMVPSILMEIDEMPVSPSGKTDVKRLPEPVAQERGYVAPGNDVEKFFCDTVADVLNLDKVGATDNFFEIGGTSLVAMRLSAAVGRGGYKLAYKDIFDNPTPEAMAAFVGGGAVSRKAVRTEEKFITAYDYSRFADVLGRNVESTYLKDTSVRPLGSVFLTGATGFLGIHVLHELLEDRGVPEIRCLVRGKDSEDAMSRIQTMLFYYFGNIYVEEQGKRLFVVQGDVTKPIDPGDIHIDTVINCAANVKHFSSGTDIEDINIGGVLNCIDLCLRKDALLIHTSTGSVSGVTISDDPHAVPHMLLENELYFGQTLDNKYIRSKFIAERSVLEAIAEKGLKAKIMRLGNLAPRSSDGEFQINFHSNSYMGRLKSYRILQAIPFRSLVAKTEMSPVDETAKAICLLAGTNPDCTVFNVVNSHRSLYLDMINCMNRMGLGIRAVDSATFNDILQEALRDPKKADVLQSMLAYAPRGDGDTAVFNSYASDYTAEVLYNLGFSWNPTTIDYMERFLKQIRDLDFFDDYNR